MTEKFKVLSAMLALDEFTPDELSRFSDVKIGTVRTVLLRHTHTCEIAGQVETGRRGGQPVRYRLTPGGRAELRRQLQETFDALIGPATSLPGVFRKYFGTAKNDKSGPAIRSLGLDAATDTIDRLLPQAKSVEEELDLLRLAERQARSALHEAGDAAEQSERAALVRRRLGDIRRRREVLSEQGDARTIVALAGGRHFEPLPAHAGQRLRLHVWCEPEGRGEKQLLTKVVQTLQREGDLLLSPSPGEAPAALQAHDAAILVIDSSSSSAAPQFKRAMDLCRLANKPLLVLDEHYSASFRNMVLGAGAADYLNDAAALDSDGIVGIVGRAARLGKIDPGNSNSGRGQLDV